MATINYSKNIEQVDDTIKYAWKGKVYEFDVDNDRTYVYKVPYAVMEYLFFIVMALEGAINDGNVSELDQFGFSRTFFINNSGSDLRVQIGGKFFRLANGSAYACHPSEWLLIDEQTDGELTRCSAETWLANYDEKILVFVS